MNATAPLESKSRKIIDISPTISPKIGVWPGDTPFSQRFLLNLEQGDNLTLSTIESTVHLGAHTDAPSHYQAGGKDISERSLDYYYGHCQVIDVSHLPRGTRITPNHFDGEITAKRVLFRTASFPNPDHFNTDFCSLSADVVHFLAAKGVCLIGIDTPSVDLFDDKKLESHQAIGLHDLAILEGVVLSHVQPGLYTLIALPLKISLADASPVRAALIPS
jgi:arylformamidase